MIIFYRSNDTWPPPHCRRCLDRSSRRIDKAFEIQIHGRIWIRRSGYVHAALRAEALVSVPFAVAYCGTTG